jgi:hypothetical protein
VQRLGVIGIFAILIYSIYQKKIAQFAPVVLSPYPGTIWRGGGVQNLSDGVKFDGGGGALFINSEDEYLYFETKRNCKI